MNRSTLRNLGIVLFALVAILIAIETGDRGADVSSGDPLFADLKDRLNDVTMVTIERPQAEAVVLSNASGTWSVATRSDYPASVAKIREVLLALADARILEQKTDNPERYAQLGVTDPDAADSRGIRITLAGDEMDYGLIIGDLNQGANRYVRIDGQSQSLLVDQNPSLPEGPGGWLRADIVDVGAAELRSVTIRHADGETIRILKDAPDDEDFSVPDLPEGRELGYPTVANGIAGALNDLTLDDARRAVAVDVRTTTEFETFDGLRITVQTTESGDQTWISLRAEPLEEAADASPAAESASAGDAPPAAGEDDGQTAAVRAAAINDRLQGWQFSIAGFKANQLTRRWDDILKAESDEP